VERELERRVDGLERQVRSGFTARVTARVKARITARVRVRVQCCSKLWWSGSWSAASTAWNARYH